MNIYDESKTNVLFSHRFYNYKLKFVENANKNTLYKNRIHLISNYKFKQIKKYLNEHLRIFLSYLIMFYWFFYFIC